MADPRSLLDSPGAASSNSGRFSSFRLLLLVLLAERTSRHSPEPGEQPTAKTLFGMDFGSLLPHAADVAKRNF